MLWLNTMAGLPRKMVRATVTFEIDMVVGGDDDEDMKDSVRELFDDGYDEIAGSTWFQDGVRSMTLNDVAILDEACDDAEDEEGDPVSPDGAEL